MTAPTAPAPGYYTDPLDPAGQRWWDGSAWTETVRSTGSVATSEAAPTATSGRAEEPGQVQEPGSADAPVPAEDQQVTLEPLTAPDGIPSVVRVEPDLPAQPAQPVVPAGLYPDPYGQAPLRWWDGRQWTTQISGLLSGPAAGQLPGQTPEQAVRSATDAHRSVEQSWTPAPALRGGSTVLPGRSAGGARAGAMGPRSLRFGKRSLAGALVLVLAAGVRVYFLVSDSADRPSPAGVAAAINLRPGDLPKAWTVPASTSAATGGDDSDTSGQAFERAVDRCIGAPDRAASATYTGSSRTWIRGSSEISSDVSVLRSKTLAQQDLRAEQSPKVASCISRVGPPTLRTGLAAKGVTLTGFAATRLPGAAADGFALRTKMTLAGGGRTLTIWNDEYGFVRDNVEVSLTQVSTGVAPDRTIAAHVVAQLRARAVAALPH